MDPKNILLIGVKGSVLAFRRSTGARLWSAKLKSSSLSSDFVSFTADETRVYAHTGGELFCLDLQTGNQLWHDGLTGLGYDVATLGLPGMPISADPVYEAVRQQAAAAATHTSTSSH